MVSKQIHKETDLSRLGHFTRQKKKHLPVIKLYYHQVQRSHKLWHVFEWLYRSGRSFFHHANYGHFRQLRLVRNRFTLNQTQRCSVVRSYLLGDESCVCEPASAHLSLQEMRLSYFKNSDFTPSLQRNIKFRVGSLSKLFYKKNSVLFMRYTISDICVQ